MKAAIVVVDDSAGYRCIFSRILASSGYKVLSAQSAEEARLVPRTSPPDAALLDLNLPGDSRLALAREICLDPGLKSMLPVNAQELLARLGALIAKRR